MVEQGYPISIKEFEDILRSDDMVDLGEALPLNCLQEIFYKIAPRCDSGLEALIALVQSPIYKKVSEKEPIATALYVCQAISLLESNNVLATPSQILLEERYRLLSLVEKRCAGLQSAFEKSSPLSTEGQTYGIIAQLRVLRDYVGASPSNHLSSPLAHNFC
jgi:hypothetical protein